MTNLEICEACPFLVFNRACQLCACPVDVTTSQAGQSCPEGKWSNA